MLFFIKAKVHMKDLSEEELWDKWEMEAKVALYALEKGKLMGAYKVAGQKTVILIYDASTHDELDKTFTAGLPLSEYIEIEEMLPIRSYQDFAVDIQKRWK